MFFSTILSNAKFYSGNDFFVYHVDKNNSEKFVHDILKSNQLISLSVDEFLRQSSRNILRSIFIPTDDCVGKTSSNPPLSTPTSSSQSEVSAVEAIEDIIDILISRSIDLKAHNLKLYIYIYIYTHI